MSACTRFATIHSAFTRFATVLSAFTRFATVHSAFTRFATIHSALSIGSIHSALSVGTRRFSMYPSMCVVLSFRALTYRCARSLTTLARCAALRVLSSTIVTPCALLIVCLGAGRGVMLPVMRGVAGSRYTERGIARNKVLQLPSSEQQQKEAAAAAHSRDQVRPWQRVCIAGPKTTDHLGVSIQRPHAGGWPTDSGE